jgi:hypothetical protein
MGEVFVDACMTQGPFKFIYQLCYVFRETNVARGKSKLVMSEYEKNPRW